jgi:competence protein ComEC
MRSNIFILSAVLFMFGAWIGVSYFGLGKKPNQYQAFLEQKVILDGYVVSDPEKYAFNQQRFEIIPETKFKQRILATSSARTPLAYGDKIYLIGKIKTPKSTGEFDYVNYLAAQNIYAEISAPQIFIVGKTILNPVVYFGLKVKHFVYRRFQRYLPQEQSALLIALIVGQKDLMSKNAVNAFNAAGVAHLIAVSGFVLTLLLIFSEKLGAYIGKKKVLVLCLALAIIYIVMANFAAGVIRAALMTGIYLLSKRFGRQYQVLPALALTAALLVAINPLIIKYDIGFMLSFLSILGIVLYVPLLKIILSKLPEQFQIKEIVATTLAAQLITAPLVIYYFKQFSLIAPVTNLLIVPTIPVTLWLGYSLCLPWVAAIAAKPLLVVLNFILMAVFGLAQISHASIALSIGWRALVGIYIAQAALYLLGCQMLKEALLFDRMLK